MRALFTSQQLWNLLFLFCVLSRIFTSIHYIEENFPDVIIIKSNQNLGYAGGCNLGIEKATNDYIVFLNNDTIVEKDWDINRRQKIKLK